MELKLNLCSQNIKSFVYTNIVSNPTFVNTTGWNATGATLSASANTLSVTANGTQIYGMAFQNTATSIIEGNKIFAFATFKVTNAVCTNLALHILGSSTGSQVVLATKATPSQDTLYTLSGVGTVPVGSTGFIRVRVRHDYANTTTANGKVLQLQDFFAIDLTALYGAGNEPSATDCANIFRFVDGTKQPSFSKQIAL